MMEWIDRGIRPFGRGPLPPPRGWFGPERRVAHRDSPLGSLLNLLEQARRRSGIDALAVADETGCLVAGAGVASTCELLAAVAPLLAEPPIAANDTIPTRWDVLARRSEVRRITVDGLRVLICGQGETAARHAVLEETAAGCVRILGRHRPRG